MPVTKPSRSAVEAAISLLLDRDPRVVAACRRQLRNWGDEAVPALRRAVAAGEPVLRLRARAMLRSVLLHAWTEGVRQFSEALNRAPLAAYRDYGVLQTGALLLAGLDRDSTTDHGEVARALDDHADAVRELLRGRPRTAARAARALRDYLGDQAGFASKHVDHYDVRANNLDEALESRLGTATALAALYVLVGRRTGMCITAVGLPDHVIVRVHGARSVLIDPSRGGRIVTHADCIRGVRRRGYTGPASSCLRELDDRELLLCLLDGLHRVHGYREDAEVLATIRRARASLSARARRSC